MKTGRARGGEAVTLVENIRSYYDILERNTESLAPSIAGSNSIKRLVADVEQRRKDYVKRMAAEKVLAAIEIENSANNETNVSLAAPQAFSEEALRLR
jgi:membrane-bound lytic murein transglycosylase F